MKELKETREFLRVFTFINLFKTLIDAMTQAYIFIIYIMAQIDVFTNKFHKLKLTITRNKK